MSCFTINTKRRIFFYTHVCFLKRQINNGTSEKKTFTYNLYMASTKGTFVYLTEPAMFSWAYWVNQYPTVKSNGPYNKLQKYGGEWDNTFGMGRSLHDNMLDIVMMLSKINNSQQQWGFGAMQVQELASSSFLFLRRKLIYIKDCAMTIVLPWNTSLLDYICKKRKSDCITLVSIIYIYIYASIYNARWKMRVGCGHHWCQRCDLVSLCLNEGTLQNSKRQKL